MRTTYLVLIGVIVGVAVLATAAFAGGGAPGKPIPDASFTTIFKSSLGLEGLTGDAEGNVYSTGRNANPCPVYRVPSAGGAAVVVGNVPAPCSPSGIAFGPDGRLYVSDNDEIVVLAPDVAKPPTASVYASGLPGTNGLAFDRFGNIWTGDGTTGVGRVWRVDTNGVATEVFRIQPLVNGAGVGREVRTLPGTPQALVANGVAFDHDGSLLVADTARGALWRVDPDNPATGCDTTFTANTLCLDNVWVQHPYLEGADGIALDAAGNVWAAANERNALVVVSKNGNVSEFFRNAAAPDSEMKLVRNGGPLEFPTSPFLLEHTLCVTSSDGNRRDNSPNLAGETRPGSATLAKISCLDQRLSVPGLDLPVG